MMQKVEVGTIVRFVPPGSRDSGGDGVPIPGVVMRQWEDGSLCLYLFHFEGVPSLLRSIPLAMVELVKQPSSALKFEAA